MHKHLALAAIAAAAPLAAQSNTVAGLDGRLTEISDFSILGHNSTHVAGAARNDMCNPGSVDIPWFQAMAENHPKFGFLVAREMNGRFEQISDRSFCKHAFLSVNGSGDCGTCQHPGTGQLMGLNCTDAYGVFNNGDRYWLGPANEIDPWLGTWNHVGSYFDRGEPDVGPPNNTDGIRSPISPPDNLTNRVNLKKSDLALPGATYSYQIQLIHEGESVQNRTDNLMSRGTVFSPSGSTFTATDDGGTRIGPILYRWSGASVTSGGNGPDDGRFFVGVKVTSNGNGSWRYEYAVQNVDNSRGGASFRVPMCPTATATNFFFRDIDDDSLNQWTASQVGNEVVFSGPMNNPLDWNTIYNFGFDADASPGSGDLFLDAARVGPGALTVTVNSTVPNGAPQQIAVVNTLSPAGGCGTPAVTITPTSLPTSPNLGLHILSQGAPNAALLLAYSFNTGNTVLAPGCTQQLDPNTTGTYAFSVANSVGVQVIPFPIPAGLGPFSLYLQLAQTLPNGPVYGAFGLSDTIQLQMSVTGGCP